MGSPDDPEATAEAAAVPARRRPLADEPVALPVYRPRRRTRARFWVAFVVAAMITAAVVWLVLA